MTSWRWVHRRCIGHNTSVRRLWKEALLLTCVVGVYVFVVGHTSAVGSSSSSSSERELRGPSKSDSSNKASIVQTTTQERPPEYAQRLARIKSVCESNHPIARKLRTQSLEVSRNIIVDDEYKILYCAVGKIACTNWRRVFLSLYDPARFPDPRNITIKSAHTVKLRQLSDYKWDEQVHRLDTYYKFMFARHPFERLASAYRSKFTYDLPYNRQYHRHYGTRIIEYYRPDASPQSLAEGKDVRFDEFLKFLADPESDSVDQNRHWSHVYHACNPCQITYDLVGKMETLERDAAQVIREAGVPSVISFPTREDANYQNKMASEIVGELMAGVAPSLVQQIYRVYELDFSMFGYEWPIRGT